MFYKNDHCIELKMVSFKASNRHIDAIAEIFNQNHRKRFRVFFFVEFQLKYPISTQKWSSEIEYPETKKGMRF